MIHEGTGCTDRVAHDYKSTASKLLGGNNTDRRGAYVYIQRTSAQGVCVVASNMRVNTYTTCMHKYVLLHGRLLLTAHTHAQKSGDKGVSCIDSGGWALICAAVKLNILLSVNVLKIHEKNSLLLLSPLVPTDIPPTQSLSLSATISHTHTHTHCHNQSSSSPLSYMCGARAHTHDHTHTHTRVCSRPPLEKQQKDERARGERRRS